MAKRSNSKAAKIRALLAERPDAKASEVVEALKSQKVRVTAAQVYNVKATSGNGKPAAKKATSGFESLVQAKKLADAMGGLDKARAALDVLARLV